MRSLLFLPLLALAAPASAAVEGRWRTPAGATVEVAPCGQALCGTIVQAPPAANGAVPRDMRNPDPALRNRPIVGVRLLSGFRREGERWTGGRIYNPQDGRTYRSDLRLEGNELKVRGCVLVACRTQTWTRVR